MTNTLDAIERRGGGVRTMLRKVAGQPYPTIVLVGSLLLSIASFFTTFNGMLHFMPILAVTFCIVFAIQGLLFVTSWRIGFAVAERESWPVFTTLVFVICLATSAFFSWVALFEYINDDAAQERTRTARIHSAVETNSDALSARIAERRDASVERMLASPAFAAWEDSIAATGVAALDARDALDAARDAEAADLAADIRILEERKSGLVRGTATSAGLLAQQERRLGAIEADRPAIVERIATLRAEFDALREQVVVKEGEMIAEETGGLSGAGAGKGPNWRALRDERNVLAAQRDAKGRLLEDATAELGRLDTEIATLSAEIAAARAGSGSPELDLIDRQIADVRQQLEQLGGGGALATDVAEMKAAVTAFKTRHDLADFDKAIAICGRLVGAMRVNPTLSATAAGLRCDPGALSTQLTPIRAAVAAETRLAARCAAGGASAPVIIDLSFAQSVEYGRECITLSGLPAAEVEPLRGEIERLILEEDPDASGFVRAVNAWFSGDKLAYLAAAIALFIDLLVLFSGLIGALSTSGKLQRALGRALSKGEIEDFERALRPEVAQFILDWQRALERQEAPKSGARGGRRARYSATIDLDSAKQRAEEDRPTARIVDRARAFLIAQKSKMLASNAPHGAVSAPGASATTSDLFYLSDDLMRGLRAYLETPESHRLDGLPLAGAISDYERRSAARGVRKHMRPYRGDWRRPGDWTYVARIDLSKIDADAGLYSDSSLLESAKQILIGLYSEGLARPESFDHKDDKSELVYLLKDDALELLDRAARLDAYEAEQARIDAEQRRQEEEQTRKRNRAERAREEARRARALAAQRTAELEAPERPAMLPPAEPQAETQPTETVPLSLEADAPPRLERAAPTPSFGRLRAVEDDELEAKGLEETGSEPAEAAKDDDPQQRFHDSIGLSDRFARLRRDKRDRSA